jgi:hypothetical protein
MSNHHGKPAFLITRAAKAVNPLDAGQLLREDNAYVRLPGRGRGTDRFDTDLDFPLPVDSGYDRRQAAFYHPEEPEVLVLADDAVLLMIGNTRELVEAVTESKQRGLRMIRTSDEKPLQCYFARIKVSEWSLQIDTLLAISSDDYYWSNVHHAAEQTRDLWHLPGLPNKQLGAHLGGLHKRTYVSTEADDPGKDVTTTSSLIQIVEGCKNKTPSRSARTSPIIRVPRAGGG